MSNTTNLGATGAEDSFSDSTFVVTDGTRSFTVTLIETGTGAAPLLMFCDDMPPQGGDLWVVHHALDQGPHRDLARTDGGVICFTPGTLIDTPEGPRLIDHLREGDQVLTKDNGPQEILWKGARRMTGARLFAMPQLRPIRIRTGAFGLDRPDNELLVSPEHRMLVRGDVARALFNTDEVLVAARDMVNGQSVCVDMLLREVTYIHIMLSDHQVLWANGIETESFHPANTALASLDTEDRLRLLAGFPDLEYDAQLYGPYARRNLSPSEAAILMHEAA
ncbi:Hint domain-containing protein [Mesobacterium pallidum]|uniref:Hint domain-containing protein n=1 Tax=Mesobacterium pallidum TaxID=2872037 RepID=UPI00300C5DE9